MIKIYKEHLIKQGFELEEKIASGLSGQVMKANQGSLNRPVIVKFFDNQFNKNNEPLIKKFLRESQLLAELQHPNIPYVITNGEIKNNGASIPYIVMQYISGVTLEKYIKTHKQISLDTALSFSVQILDALSYAHERKIFHRDIKPSNIMVSPSGHCFLIDFSISYKDSEQPGMTRLTRTGDHLGTIKYMSPEQQENMKDVDGRSDIYSYSLVLCELLSGEPTLEGLDKNVNQYPIALRKVIKKGGSYKLEDRFSNAQEFIRELKQLSTTSLPLHDTPSKAVCDNTICPDANWSQQGYYKGVNFIEQSTEGFCTACGNKLAYQCRSCGNPITNTPYCGGCGDKQFDIPECKKCGSYLTRQDMDKDTEHDGCEKCRNKKKAQITQPSSMSFDDDIPF